MPSVAGAGIYGVSVFEERQDPLGPGREAYGTYGPVFPILYCGPSGRCREMIPALDNEDGC